jgi:hypothetical protein
MFMLLSGLALLLSACRSAPGSAPATGAPTATREPSIPTATPGEPMQCTLVSAQPTPGPTEQSLFPSVGERDWIKGPDSASLTIIEYSDFQ